MGRNLIKMLKGCYKKTEAHWFYSWEYVTAIYDSNNDRKIDKNDCVINQAKVNVLVNY